MKKQPTATATVKEMRALANKVEDAATCAALRENGGIYLCAIGGAGALAARHIRAAKVIAFDDLGCEAIKQLELEDFPLFVGEDCHGGSLFLSE